MKEKPEILIVDDQFEICTLLEHVFQSLEFKTISANSILETKYAIEHSKDYPKAIVLDNNLPDGLGFDLIPELKKLLPNTRIIAMTAERSTHTKEKTLNAGADIFLEKPFNVKDIYKAISEAEIV